MRDMVDTWDRTMKEIFEEKKRALMAGDEALVNQVAKAKDLLSILMKANMEASEEDKLHDKEVLGQERLRAEVTEARKVHDGDIHYDYLVSLPFLDAVCRETLRLQDTVLPLLTPIKAVDGQEMESILVPKDTLIFISILNANRDPLLWGPDCLEWKPERWMGPLPEALHEARMPGIYSHLLTFLGGGRACIGFKFSQLEMKVILSILISQFRFYPAEKEISWQFSFITTPTLVDSPETPQLPLIVELVKA
ncbi:hypothetical protein C0993_005327 [Termitomyces sp. T159_Od127]|nr:hypothetical protein C0993_005327 [Termitomyces sp. T159_Od127]